MSAMRRVVIRPGLSAFVTLAAMSVLGLVIPVPSAIGQAKGAGGQLQSEARGLTQEFIVLHGLFQNGNSAERAAVLSKLADMAARRRQALAELMESNPGEVLRVSIPAAVRGDLPASIQELMEDETTLEGTLEVTYECGEQKSRLLFGLQTAAEKLSLHFAQNEPGDLQTGAQVRVRGVRVGTALALGSGNNAISVQALTSILPRTFGEQKTAVILVNFQDNATQPYTPDYARGVVFNTTSSFDMENSHGQTWLTGDVFGWYTIPVSSTVCDTTSIANYAKQAASAAGAVLSAYSHFVYGFPSNACTWWGLGSVGGNPSSAWINGSFTLKVVGHEMGHNLGLYHSRTVANEYGDIVDIMGNPSAGHFNAFQKERLGWLNYGAQPPITTVQASGNYTIDPFEVSGGNPKALKILQSVDSTTGQKTWYYVEHRRGIGFDSSLASNLNVINGVIVHTGSESTGNSSFLLDMTPATSTFNDPALIVGSSFGDVAAGVTISTLSTSSTGAMVSVTLGSQACARAAPALTPTSLQSQWGAPGSALSFALTLTNRDSSGCGATTYNLAATPPGGWTAVITPAAVTLAAGGTASVTVQLTSPSTAPNGLYDTQIVATNSSDANDTASATVTYGVSDPACIPGTPILTTAPSLSSPVPAGSSLSFTLTLANTDCAACAATTFNLKASPPAGWTYSFNLASVTVNPGASANVTLKITAPASAPDGSYNVAITATSSTDSGKTASGSVTCALVTPVAASVITNKASYSNSEKVSITATVTAGGAPSAGASVNFTITKPNGTSVNQTVTTASNGTATYSYQLNRKDPAGSYKVDALATANSKSAQATAAFTVAAATNGKK